jgi:hypothetical protein
MNSLISSFIQDNLSGCSDIVYNENLAKPLIAIEDFSDLLQDTPPNEYVIRKHIRSFMKTYVAEVNKARPIGIKNKNQFGLQMESLGLNVGFTSEQSTHHPLPDGNVVTLALLVFGVVAIGAFAVMASCRVFTWHGFLLTLILPTPKGIRRTLQE